MASAFKQSKGFTVIELMISVAIIGLLAALAIPWMGEILEKNRLKGAAEEAQTLLQYTRSEAVKRDANVFTRFDANGTTTWCMGASTTSNCNCNLTDTTNAAACVVSIAGTNVLKRVVSTDYANIALAETIANANNEIEFDHVRGLSTENGTLTFTSPSGYEIQVRTSVLGRVMICSGGTGAGPGTLKVHGFTDCT